MISSSRGPAKRGGGGPAGVSLGGLRFATPPAQAQTVQIAEHPPTQRAKAIDGPEQAEVETRLDIAHEQLSHE